MGGNKPIILHEQRHKDFAIKQIQALPYDPLYQIRITQCRSKRSLEQNAKMWAMLNDISKQVEWYGKKLTKEVWKAIFSASIFGQETVPGLDNNFVVVAKSTSKMSISEMSDVIECCYAFGADPDHPVKWSEKIPKEWER
jgi:hypothetical protein